MIFLLLPFILFNKFARGWSSPLNIYLCPREYFTYIYVLLYFSSFWSFPLKEILVTLFSNTSLVKMNSFSSFLSKKPFLKIIVVTVVPIFPHFSPMPCPPPTSSVSPQTVVHYHVSFIYGPWIDPSSSFPCPSWSSPLVTVSLFLISISQVLFCSLVVCSFFFFLTLGNWIILLCPWSSLRVWQLETVSLDYTILRASVMFGQCGSTSRLHGRRREEMYLGYLQLTLLSCLLQLC